MTFKKIFLAVLFLLSMNNPSTAKGDLQKTLAMISIYGGATTTFIVGLNEERESNKIITYALDPNTRELAEKKGQELKTHGRLLMAIGAAVIILAEVAAFAAKK
ncbi:MAG: hypothetical protein NTX86_03525 [Candidatus Dependentiae bacterium]|nr:hypothetical protein [Candidatus Dependentiae bacterium]